MIIQGHFLSRRLLFGGLLQLRYSASLLQKSHESETLIIYQMFQNHKTNACLLLDIML